MNTTIEGVTEILANHCELPAQGVDTDTPLASLDLDSLTMLEVGFALERRFGGQVDDAALAEAETVGDLVRVAESCPSPG